jgi:hypothetical protein
VKFNLLPKLGSSLNENGFKTSLSVTSLTRLIVFFASSSSFKNISADLKDLNY